MRLSARDAARLGLPVADTIPEALRGAYADLERRKGVNARCDALGVERPADFVARKQAEFEAKVAGIVEEGARRIAEVEARTWRFTVEGQPVPKSRPRVTKRGTYTPKKTRDFEAEVNRAARAAGVRVGKGPARVHVRAFYRDRGGPDSANVLAAVLDGLVGRSRGKGQTDRPMDDDRPAVLRACSIECAVDKARPRVEVEVTRCGT